MKTEVVQGVQEWDWAAAYEELDEVWFRGTRYIAVCASLNEEPADVTGETNLAYWREERSQAVTA